LFEGIDNARVVASVTCVRNKEVNQDFEVLDFVAFPHKIEDTKTLVNCVVSYSHIGDESHHVRGCS